MNRKILWVALTLIVKLTGCTHKQPPISESHSIVNSPTKDSEIYDSINKAEKMILLYSSRDFFTQRLIVYDPDPTTLICHSLNGQAMVLEICRKDEESGQPYCEMVYFGSRNGFPIIYKYAFAKNDTSITVFTEDRNVFSYIKNKEGIHVNNLDNFTKETKISAFMFEISSYMCHYNKLEYKVIPPSLNSIPVLITVTNDVALFTKPDVHSAIVDTLAQETKLFFLENNGSLDSLNGKKFSWFKVSTEDKKKTGWVVGHFSYVRELTDGD